jgi:methylenetetrahydrofolate reductase (NADH)
MSMLNVTQKNNNIIDESCSIEASIHEETRQFINDFSIEITPKECSKITKFNNLLPINTSVYVTDIKGSQLKDRVTTAKILRDNGMNPVPHIAARGIKNTAEFEEIIKQFKYEADVNQILIIGGGYDKPVGNFDCSMDLIRTNLTSHYEINRIGFAGHPEGSVDIDDNILHNVLHEKDRYASSNTHLKIHLVTQFFFDVAPVISWDKYMLKEGRNLPVHIGLHGVASIVNLIKHAKFCGVGNSIKVLMKQKKNILKLGVAKTPDKLLYGLAKHRMYNQNTLIKKCHFFPLGGFIETAEWANNIVENNFSVDHENEGIIIL